MKQECGRAVCVHGVCLWVLGVGGGTSTAEGALLMVVSQVMLPAIARATSSSSTQLHTFTLQVLEA